MSNAIWLFLALPNWYISTIADPLGAGPLTAIPAFGTICLFIGITVGLIQRAWELKWFFLPAIASQLFVAVAGALRGELFDESSQPALLSFIVFQIILAGYLIYRVGEARLAAVALAIFSVTYALFAAFIAGMSFNDTWL